MTYPTKIKKKYMEIRAQGDKPYTAAVKTGIAIPTAYVWESREEIRSNIERLAQKYISILPDAIKLSEEVIRAGNDLDKTPENAKIIDLACKEAAGVRKAVGIEPSHTVSLVINNLVIGSQTVLDGRVSALLGSQLTGIDDVIDVTPEVDSPPIE